MPNTTRLNILGSVKARRDDTASSRSKRRASSISRYCAKTFGWPMSPLPWRLASIRIDSSHRSCPASQRGVYGRKNMPTNKTAAGTIWTAHGIRNAAEDCLGSAAPPPAKDEPYWMKYWIRIPHVMAHCWSETTLPRISLGA